MHLLKMSLIYYWTFLINSSVGTFGWLDAPLPMWFAFATYILCLIFAVMYQRNSEANGLAGKRCAVVLSTFLLLSFFVTISMVNHTITVTLFGAEQGQETYNIKEAIYLIPCIGGLQGRYYLPFLPLPFLAIGKAIRQGRTQSNDKSRINYAVLLYILAAMLISCIVLYQRYWNV